MSIMTKAAKPAAGAAAAAETKRKQFSRNKKKNWRKFLNTKEVGCVTFPCLVLYSLAPLAFLYVAIILLSLLGC
jgi:hypothetical protein